MWVCVWGRCGYAPGYGGLSVCPLPHALPHGTQPPPLTAAASRQEDLRAIMAHSRWIPLALHSSRQVLGAAHGGREWGQASPAPSCGALRDSHTAPRDLIGSSIQWSWWPGSTPCHYVQLPGLGWEQWGALYDGAELAWPHSLAPQLSPRSCKWQQEVGPDHQLHCSWLPARSWGLYVSCRQPPHLHDGAGPAQRYCQPRLHSPTALLQPHTPASPSPALQAQHSHQSQGQQQTPT